MKIFPATLTPDGRKVPLIPNWESQATDDRETISQWMTQFGSAITFWGMPCGPNGIIAVDIDVKNGNGFEAIQQAGLELPLTSSQRTPSGGMHLIYKMPEGIDVKNTVSQYAQNVDTRTKGGWIALYGFDSNPIADAPKWLLEAPKSKVIQAQGVSYKVQPELAKEILDSICNDIINAPAGESNNTLNTKSFEAAQLLLATGSLTKDEVFDKLFMAAKERGKTDYESRATINSGIKAGLQAGPRNDCPFDQPIAPQNVEEFRDTWSPKKPTLGMFFDTSHLRKPQIFKDWSTEDIHLTMADGGTGKTTLKLQESIAMAIGHRFLGFENIQRGRTLFITGEDSAEKLYAICGKIMTQMNLTSDETATVVDSILIKKESDMTVVSRDNQGFYHPNIKALDKIMEAYVEHRPKMIVIDPIASFWGSEAALNDMAKAVAKFASLLVERTNACVDIINHIGKSSSQSKDVTQFAGRGGTALPSHSRVCRVYRRIDSNEYFELTGQQLTETQQALVCVINKFTDGNKLLDKPMVFLRDEYLFSRVEMSKEEKEDTRDDIQIVFDTIKEFRLNKKYPTKDIIIASCIHLISKERINHSLNLLGFKGFNDIKLKIIDNPDVTVKAKALTLVDKDDIEI